jgi:transcriptional regulator with XRE-family HTH domain
MSLEKIASMVGVTFQQVQKYQNGTNRVSASMADMLCQAFQCSISDLFAGTACVGGAPLALPAFSPQAMKVAEDFDQIECPDQRAALARLVKSLAYPRSTLEAV